MVYTRIVQPGQRKKFAYQPGETLLFRISGTVIPTVWRMALSTIIFTYMACIVFDPLRKGVKDGSLDGDQKLVLNLFKDTERVMQYFTGFITFILGFFNSIVFQRWWKMRELCGNITESSLNTAMHVAAFMIIEPPIDKGGAAALRAARRDLIRLLALGQALTLQACHRVRDLDWLIERRLLERNSAEHLALQKLSGPGYNEVYGWFITKAYAYGEDGMIDGKCLSSVLYSMRWALLQCSNCAEDLMMHLNQQVPLAYTHLLELMSTTYVLITPIGLVPSLLWMAIPIAPIVTLFFHGFFRLGTSVLLDPFQKDSGFDTTSLLSSSVMCMESLEEHVPLQRAWQGPPAPSMSDAFIQSEALEREASLDRKADPPVRVLARDRRPLSPRAAADEEKSAKKTS
eukprot:TRINITY_DN8048_c0_g1_i1.p1 TRINITY_DN8048_c0_g1~~TRINITY_DN8048_c0_g1_i1.p1  ORF type:complete len:401 (-),score=60.99 TRINITY_DN8048_c0_g1_i1:193-1395(-)